MLKGYKTYLVGIAGLVYAGLGYFMFGLDGATAVQMVQVSLAAMGLRAAV